MTREDKAKDGRSAAAVLPAAAMAVCAAAAAVILFFTSGEAPEDEARTSYSNAAAAHIEPTSPVVRMGLIDFSYSSTNSREIDRTLEVIRRAIAPLKLEAVRYRAEDLDREVKRGEIDFFVASSGFYWRMIPYGARGLATLVNPSRPDPNLSSGASFIVTASSPVHTIEDLRGLRLAASYPTAFMGYRISMADLVERGYDYEHFFRSVSFTGTPYVHGLMHKIITGDSDVTIIPSCTWEEMTPKERSGFRLVGVRENTGMECLSTTRAYPGHTLAVMNGVKPAVAARVATAVLTMKSVGGSEAWSIATDFTSVDQAYRYLRIGPYAYLREPTLRRWLRQYRSAVLFALMLVAGLAFHAWRSDELVRRRTAQLRAEESAREQASRSLEELNQRMERMHKANIVGQLSSMISHELAQPLAAIRYYCEGERELLRSPAERAEALATCNERISSQADRAIAIVEKVRSYARSEATREERVDLARTLSQVLTELRVKGIGKVEVSRLIPSSLPVRGDPLELELLFWNLLKNATEAALRSPQPRIQIEAGRTAGRAEVVIENSGPPMTAEDMERLSSPLSSGSRGGLGLGVAIARSIAESSGGGIEFSSRPAGGLSARVRLPAWEERAADKEAQA
ncbi:sensor histidine kinase [Mesosutterella sp. OilRF-GAM-744-9]|uniref:histidine kinase n=1 Tax=Mesosutterella porci TaxID=2915351 RepID=A0ABS9MQ90_9BURK|nr:sensor histidine kinase [Mesosutterella sp. oilRF-744-WT-GAM-9]MCG5030786.1 sensor histidine kinase [Mesosutterella sp. oilRF-744-WT-GAM-9]MCI6530752.1 sensor histidine kinase [Mesosutterella sp.]